MSYEALNSRIMEMKDEILAGIQQNMRIESVRGEAQPDAPYIRDRRSLWKMPLNLAASLASRLGRQTIV